MNWEVSAPSRESLSYLTLTNKLIGEASTAHGDTVSLGVCSSEQCSCRARLSCTGGGAVQAGAKIKRAKSAIMTVFDFTHTSLL